MEGNESDGLRHDPDPSWVLDGVAAGMVRAENGPCLKHIVDQEKRSGPLVVMKFRSKYLSFALVLFPNFMKFEQ